MYPKWEQADHTSYLLNQNYKTKGYIRLSDEELAQLLFVFETMATAIEQKQLVQPKKIPIMNENFVVSKGEDNNENSFYGNS